MEQYCSNDYKLNLKYLENINKHFEFIVCDIWDRKKLYIYCRDVVDYDDYIKRFNVLYEIIKDLFKKIEDGELQDISNFIFPIEYVFNIFEVKNSFIYYKCFTRCCHGIFRNKENDQKIVDCYEKNFKYLELLLSKIRIECDLKKFQSLLPKERLYLKEEDFLKIYNNAIKSDIKSRIFKNIIKNLKNNIIN